MRGNLPKLYLANFLTGLVFWYAIEKLFMQHIGINAIGVAVNAVVFLAITVLFDVPSGVLADRWKRKYTLILAMVALGISDIILGVSQDLPLYLGGTAFLGVFMVMTSGTYQAMMYDSLAEKGQQKDYDKHQGRAFGLFLAGIGLSSLAGGYIGEFIGLRETYFISVVPAILCIGVLCLTREPQFHKDNFDHKLWEHVKASARVITSQPAVFHLALFLVVAGMLRNTQNEFAGLYYLGLGFGALGMGYANAAKWIVSSAGQFATPYVGRRRVLAALPWFFVSFMAFALISNAYGFIFFLVAAFLFSLATNQTEALAQGRIPSHLRATTLSLTSFSTNVIMIPLGLLFGWLTQYHDVFKAYLMFGIIGLGYLGVWFMRGRGIVLGMEKEAAAPERDIEPIK